MKKIILATLILVSATLPAYADIFAPIGAPVKLKASEALAIPGVDPNTILGEVTQILGYLSPKEGMLLDKHGTTNYLSATIITYDPASLSLNVGTTNITPDGVALTVDWNAGKYIPAQNVPVLQYIQSATIGAGVDYRYLNKDNDDAEKGWTPSWVLTGQIKTTF